MDGVHQRPEQIGTDKEGHIQNWKLQQEELLQPLKDGCTAISNFVADKVADAIDFGENVTDTGLQILDLASPEHRVARNHCKNLEEHAALQKNPLSKEHDLRREVEFAVKSLGFDHPVTQHAEDLLLQLRDDHHKKAEFDAKGDNTEKRSENYYSKSYSNGRTESYFANPDNRSNLYRTKFGLPSREQDQDAHSVKSTSNYMRKNLTDGRIRYYIDR